MSFRRGAVYNSVNEITGPTGWYRVNTSTGPVVVHVDQDYDGGGWVMVMANRINTGGMRLLSYVDAVGNVNYRTGGSQNGENITVPQGIAVKNLGLDSVNAFVGVDFWDDLSGTVSSSKITVVQYVTNTVGAQLNNLPTHGRRFRWAFDGFGTQKAFQGVQSVLDETGTGSPGLYSHASGGNNLTTFDRDQDTNGGNCSTYYDNNPWWYSSCWTGNYFAGGSYVNGPHWTSSSSANAWNYGAVYIKRL